MFSLTMSRRRSLRALIAVILLTLSIPAPFATGKPIRLRNEVVDPAATPKSMAQAPGTSALDSPQSGLYLIQFVEPPTQAQREQLSEMGIELLRYVPEDSYIARARQANPKQVNALKNVTLMTPYRPDHKIDRGLRAPQKRAVGERVKVRVLLAPKPDGAEMLRLHRMLTRISRSNPHGTVPVLRGEIAASRLEELADSPAVLWIEADKPMRLFDEVSSKIVAGDSAPHQTSMQELGFDGQGVGVSVADSGLHNGDAASMHPDLAGRTPAFFYYGALTDAADEHSHGTHVAGIVAGNGATGETDENGAFWGLGVAPGASIITQRIFDGVGNYEAPPSYETLTTDAMEAGAVIGSNSWGDDTQGRYDISAAEFDALVRDGNTNAPGDQAYILEFSAGNAGPGVQTIGSPAVGKNVLATGACQNDRPDLYIYDTGPDTMADFSSRGPCEDGRIKPDVVAPGTWIASLQSASATDEFAWAAISPNYQYQGGTSQAGPHASGAAAIFVQFYRATHTNATPSPALVKAALINSAVPMDPDLEVGPAPNNDEGWGRIDLTELIGSPRTYEYFDQSSPLVNGGVWEHRVVVGSDEEALKITLTYTDVPGLPAALPALVNDLDLEVISPEGLVFRGNQFLSGESVPNLGLTDSINNIEAVHLQVPSPGEYLVRVIARKVVEDARRDTPSIDQDFALVISGDLPEPGHGIILMDRHSYTAPGQIKVRLIDTDLIGQGSASVTLQSDTEPVGETLVLAAANATGTFTGVVATVTGAANADGMLQVAHGNQIRAVYFDNSGLTNKVAYAVADLVAPVLGGVGVRDSFGSMVISWTSDEPASSVVFYGTTPSLGLGATNFALSTFHEVTLSGLEPGQTYFFSIQGTDEAGNTRFDNNGGQFYTFVAAAPSTVLVLDAGRDSYGMFPIPALIGYTETLNQIGVSYSVWDTSVSGVPGTNVLGTHAAVICRLPELVGNLTPQQSVLLCNNLSNYVARGGSLFVSTMEGLSRLEEDGAAAFVRNVLHVADHAVDVGVSEIVGVPGEVVGSGVDQNLDYTPYQDLWEMWIPVAIPSADLSDTLTPDTNAVPVLTDAYGYVTGLRWPKTGQSGPGRVVLFSFPLDAVPLYSGGVHARANLLRNVLDFLVPGLSGSKVVLDRPSYTIPAIATFEINDPMLVDPTTATLRAFSPQATNGVPLTISRLTQKGVFAGMVELVSATTAPAPGQLPVAAGDTIRIEYFDAVANSTVSATAEIDTTAPVISNVNAIADYLEVTISWETSEPTDGLVQLGASSIFDRSEYDSTISTQHEVTIRNLQADTLYYFKISSRDVAGNVGGDDNFGQFHTIRTLKPLSAPWSDDLEGSNNWTTYDAEGSQAIWTLGVPNNELAESAYSPVTAWGCNLSGQYDDYAETFLISPAILLGNGNSAKLQFWHNYDFIPRSEWDIIEFGQIYVLTNNVSQPIPIAAFEADMSYGWELVEIDLSRFMGQVIYVVWQYDLFAMEGAVHPGWLIDDVSITVSNSVTATVRVTNNIWQASWTLSGPTPRSGAGAGTTISNAIPGEYRITWNDVPFYQTPAPRTNMLAAGAMLTFQGEYSIVDANANGISDSWEQKYFGSVGNHPGTLDTDNDGASDYAEFVAGTNPTNALSVFEVNASPLTTGTVQLEWLNGFGRAFRVLGSTNAESWQPVSDWLYGTNRWLLPAPAHGDPYLFKLEVQP